MLLILSLLLPVLGFRSGPQMDSEEARRAASSAPEVDELLTHPTIKTSADYIPPSDSWRVVLTEEVSRTAVAELTVMDDTRKVCRSQPQSARGTHESWPQ